MDGLVLENKLNSVQFELAAPADDAEIRRLLRENPMPGRIRISLEREPDASLAAAVEGDVHHMVVARDTSSGRLVAMGGVAVRDAFVNGRVKRVGYLGQLRLDHRHSARGTVLVGGYRFFRELMPTLGTDVCFTSIAADNGRARRLLERGLPGMPTYRPLGELVTSLFPAQVVPVRVPLDLSVDRAGAERVGEMLECLNRNAVRYNLFPSWREADLVSRIESDELEPILATRGGRVVGCMAAWNQKAYKQTVVRGYSPPLSRWRRVVNGFAPLMRMPYLPPVGMPLNLIYLSHVAVDDDDPNVFAALLRYACSPTDLWFGQEKRSYFVLGLTSRHPLLRAVPRRFRRHTYRTMLYTVHWQDDPPAATTLDGRHCQPEVALL